MANLHLSSANSFSISPRHLLSTQLGGGSRTRVLPIMPYQISDTCTCARESGRLTTLCFLGDSGFSSIILPVSSGIYALGKDRKSVSRVSGLGFLGKSRNSKNPFFSILNVHHIYRVYLFSFCRVSLVGFSPRRTESRLWLVPYRFLDEIFPTIGIS